MNHPRSPAVVPPPPLAADQTLASLATAYAGASRVFQRHGLDFCCHGDVTLAAACARKNLSPATLLSELQAETTKASPATDWPARPLSDLIDHIEHRFHAAHRAELPRLLQMATRVEHVHGEKDTCPRGLSDLLSAVASSLEQHMQKEEQVLFPMLRAGPIPFAAMPIHVMEEEHVEHGLNLERLRALAHDYQPPAEACGTWRALYLGLEELEREVMEHIHLENHVLFPRASQTD